MKTFGVGELKANFSEIVDRVRLGEEFAVAYGRKKEKVAVILPYAHFRRRRERKLGILKGQARCVIGKDFTMTDEELAGP